MAPKASTAPTVDPSSLENSGDGSLEESEDEFQESSERQLGPFSAVFDRLLRAFKGHSSNAMKILALEIQAQRSNLAWNKLRRAAWLWTHYVTKMPKTRRNMATRQVLMAFVTARIRHMAANVNGAHINTLWASRNGSARPVSEFSLNLRHQPLLRSHFRDPQPSQLLR
jgi:hypothetical protein